MRLSLLTSGALFAAVAFAAETGAGSAARAAKTDAGAPANIPAATEFDPSGAPVQIVSDVDPSHPAVDNDPRANTTVDQNRIDFNDPTLTGAEAVAKNLADQGSAQKTAKD